MIQLAELVGTPPKNEPIGGMPSRRRLLSGESSLPYANGDRKWLFKPISATSEDSSKSNAELILDDVALNLGCEAYVIND